MCNTLCVCVCVSLRLPSRYQTDVGESRRREEGADRLHGAEPAGPSALHLRPPGEHRRGPGHGEVQGGV